MVSVGHTLGVGGGFSLWGRGGGEGGRSFVNIVLIVKRFG